MIINWEFLIWISNVNSNSYKIVNNVENHNKDYAYTIGIKYIEIIVVIANLLEFVQGYKVIEFNKIISIDLRKNIIDVKFKGYSTIKSNNNQNS